VGVTGFKQFVIPPKGLFCFLEGLFPELLDFGHTGSTSRGSARQEVADRLGIAQAQLFDGRPKLHPIVGESLALLAGRALLQDFGKAVSAEVGFI
jgi:hypothetical protein